MAQIPDLTRCVGVKGTKECLGMTYRRRFAMSQPWDYESSRYTYSCECWYIYLYNICLIDSMFVVNSLNIQYTSGGLR